RCSNCEPSFSLRSLARTKPRRLPGVTCCCSMTRQRSPFCLTRFPLRRRVAGTFIPRAGPDGERGIQRALLTRAKPPNFSTSADLDAEGDRAGLPGGVDREQAVAEVGPDPGHIDPLREAEG